MHGWHYLFLILSSFAAGLINAVAGGGSLLTYPLLLSSGLSPIIANATSTVIIWPGAISSAIGYRKHISKLRWNYYLLLIPCAIGGLVGAIILFHTSNHDFSRIVPFFFLLAVFLILIQPTIKKWLNAKDKKKKAHRKNVVVATSVIVLIAASVYGGYFGAGFGIIMLAILGFTTLTDIQEMNGLKNLSGASINLAAMIYFMIHHLVDWKILPALLIASTIGGWLGSNYSSKLPSKAIRYIIVVVGFALAIALFIKPKL